MKEIKYCVIGGGVAGVGFVDGLIQKNEDNYILVEGRDELNYSLNWMPYFKRESKLFKTKMTGVEFKQYLTTKKRDSSKISFSSRLLDIDKKNNIIFVNFNGEKTEQIKYEKLIIATGGLQILYGSNLLPGYRGAGIFTTYQIGEMLTLYNFLMGNQLFILGRGQYAYETAKIAQRCGINTTIGIEGKFDFADEKLTVYENIELLEILGEKDKKVTGVVFTHNNKTITLEVDSFAVDGKFIIEHKLRDILGLKWDLENNNAKLNNEFFLEDSIIITGDAKKPDCNFMYQYETAFNLAKEL